MTRITVLGLGAMGSRMATRLLAAGNAVTVWNRSPGAADALRAQGAAVAATPRQAVEDADVALAMVFDDAASRHVWLDDITGAMAGLPKGALAIESSTLTPAWLAHLNSLMEARGISFVDAPVAGSRPQAEAGQLIFMAGGEPAAIERARPVLQQLGGAVHVIGPAGSGAWLKLVVNALFGIQVAAVAECLALLKAAGIDSDAAFNALRTMPVMSAAATGAGTMIQARNFAPLAPVDLIVKDLDYALQSAHQVGASMPLISAVADRFLAASAAGYGQENLVAIAKLYG